MIATMVLLVCCFFIVVYGSRFTATTPSLLGREYASMVKGICALVVIMVHIPAEHGNKIQDAIGSLAFVCVTLFFLYSSYGLNYSLVNKKDYLRGFWATRLPALLLPFLIAYGLKAVMGYSTISGGVRFVYILLGYYALFYLLNRLCNGAQFVKDATLAGIVVVASVVGYFFKYGVGWYPEMIGLAYGVLLANRVNGRHPLLYKSFYWIMGALLAMSLLVGFSYLKLKHVDIWGDYALKILLGGVLIVTSYQISLRVQIGNRLLALLGKISYEIFLVHGFVINALEELQLPNRFFVPATVAASIALAAILYVITRPMIEKISSLLNRQNSAALAGA
jgi:peptidoglycan/LPS O-acetylase OafA/YrhL